MIAPRPGDPCLADCTALFAHIEQNREIYRALMSGESRVIAESIVLEAIEERIAQIISSSPRNTSGARKSPTFVPRFIASTLLALATWSLEQGEPPPATKLQYLYGSLVGRALEVAL
jgi:hypothetical protein